MIPAQRPNFTVLDPTHDDVQRTSTNGFLLAALANLKKVGLPGSEAAVVMTTGYREASELIVTMMLTGLSLIPADAKNIDVRVNKVTLDESTGFGEVEFSLSYAMPRRDGDTRYHRICTVKHIEDIPRFTKIGAEAPAN